MARNKEHAEQIQAWKSTHIEAVREQARKDQKAWRERQQVKRTAQRKAEAIQSGQALINEEGKEQVKESLAIRAKEDRDR